MNWAAQNYQRILIPGKGYLALLCIQIQSQTQFTIMFIFEPPPEGHGVGRARTVQGLFFFPRLGFL